MNEQIVKMIEHVEKMLAGISTEPVTLFIGGDEVSDVSSGEISRVVSISVKSATHYENEHGSYDILVVNDMPRGRGGSVHLSEFLKVLEEEDELAKENSFKLDCKIGVWRDAVAPSHQYDDYRKLF